MISDGFEEEMTCFLVVFGCKVGVLEWFKGGNQVILGEN